MGVGINNFPYLLVITTNSSCAVEGIIISKIKPTTQPTKIFFSSCCI